MAALRTRAPVVEGSFWSGTVFDANSCHHPLDRVAVLSCHPMPPRIILNAWTVNDKRSTARWPTTEVLEDRQGVSICYVCFCGQPNVTDWPSFDSDNPLLCISEWNLRILVVSPTKYMPALNARFKPQQACRRMPSFVAARLTPGFTAPLPRCTKAPVEIGRAHV